MKSRIQEEVEPADLVRAVVRAVPRADAAVVDHLVQPLGAVHRGVDRADDFARRVLAVHAGHGLVEGLRGVEAAPVVAVDADPLHGAAPLDLLLADDGDVVLGLAGDHAGVAADAGREVDRHAPGVAAAGKLRVHGVVRPRRRLAHVRHDRGVLAIGRGRDRAHGGAALHRMLVLRRRERVALERLADLDARRRPEAAALAQNVRVEARAVRDPASARAAVAEVHGDAALGLPRHDPDRGLDAPPRIGELDDVLRREAELLRRGRRHQRGVLPRQLRQGLRELLEPAVVGVGAVPDRRGRDGRAG